MASEKQPGYYMGTCIAIFAPIGIVLWLITDNPGLIGAGVAIGVAIGAGMDSKTGQARKKASRKALGLAALALLAGLSALVLMFWLM